MIVECNSCQTRFQLDERRVPPQGIRVRCSRCKQAFFLEHPSASQSQAVNQIAQEAASGEGIVAPGATQDLTVESQVHASKAAPSMSSPGLPAEVHGDSFLGTEFEEAEESDWEFIDDLPGGEAGDDEIEDDLVAPGISDSDVAAEVAATSSGSVFSAEDFGEQVQPEETADRGNAGAASTAAELASNVPGSVFSAEDFGEQVQPEETADRGNAGVGSGEFGVSGRGGSVAASAGAKAAADTREPVFGSVDEFCSLMEDDSQVAQAREAAAAQETAAPEAVLESEGDLGEPEDWDFFSDESLEETGSVVGVLAAKPTQGAASAPQVAMASLVGPGLDACSGAVVLPGSKAGGFVARAGRAAGWVITLGLLTVGIVRGLLPGVHPGNRVPTAVDLGDFRAEEVRGHWVETARSGVIYTVTGRLRNTTRSTATMGARLQVSLLGSAGERLELPASSAGIPMREAELRELPQERLQALQEQAAWALSVAPIEPGDTVPFLACLAEVPEEAARFLLELQAYNSPPGETPLSSPGESATPGETAATLRPSPEAPGLEVEEERANEEG